MAIKSREGERIPLDSPVMATGGVEVWLNKLLAMVRQSVNTVICNAVASAQEPEYDAIPFIEAIPAQVGSHAQSLDALPSDKVWTFSRSHVTHGS